MPVEPFARHGGRLLAAAAAPPLPPASRSLRCRLDVFRWYLSGNQEKASSPADVAYDFVRLISASTRSSWPSTSAAAHSPVLKLGLLSNVFIASALVDAYCKSKNLVDARKMFDEMSWTNAVTWNSLIRGHSQAGSHALSMNIFAEMRAAGVPPTAFTVSSALLAISFLGSEATGAMVHCIAVKHGFCSNIVVASSLVDMYWKCSATMDDAQKLFEEMCGRNVITWTSLITGYAAHQRPEEAMELLGKMRLIGLAPNEVTFSGLLGYFTGRHSLIYGKQIHSLAIRQGVDANPFVSSALISMYSRCGSTEDLRRIVDCDHSGDQVLQNSIVSGFAHLGDLPGAAEQFIRMRRRSMAADLYTFASLLWAAGTAAALEEGKQFHALGLRSGSSSSIYVQNGLVAMYARCGEIDDSSRAFSAISSPDLISWNSLISGCARHGRARHAMGLLETMRSQGVEPDATSFLSVLSACAHAGLVGEGVRCFCMMLEGPSLPTTEHYSSVVDLLGRAGHLRQAESLLNAMMHPGPSVYRSLVNACKIHGDVETATRAAARLLELRPLDSSSYVLLSSLLAEMRLWGGAAALRKQMAARGLKKEPAWSWVEENAGGLLDMSGWEDMDGRGARLAAPFEARKSRR